MEELDSAPEPVSPSTRLSDNVILTVSGDTPKDPFVASNWPDGTPGGTNWIYVISQGAIQPGWIGSIRPGARSLFNPSTGREDAMGTSTPAADCTEAALAAILYATSYGNRQRVSEFSSIDYTGIIT